MEPQEMKEAVRRLWTLCFDDTPAFMDLYFDCRYQPERNEAIVEDGRVVSALQTIPYPMKTWGEMIPAAYLSGVCTHPDVRHQGYMCRLLQQTHRHLRSNGYVVSTLIPAGHQLFQAYSSSGYASLFCYGRTVVSTQSQTLDELTVSEYSEDAKGVYAYFSRAMERYPCSLLHTTDDFQVILADLYLSHGKLWVARRDGCVCGLAFALPGSDGCRVSELQVDSEAVKTALLSEVCRRMAVGKAEILHPATADCTVHPLGMLRVIDAERLLSVYAATHPWIETTLSVIDPVIEENNADFVLSGGKCLKTNLSAVYDHPIPVACLPEHLWKDEYPYMTLMLN